MSSSKAAKAVLGSASTFAARSSRSVATGRSELSTSSSMSEQGPRLSTSANAAASAPSKLLTHHQQRCLLTKAYLRDYVDAAKRKDMSTAMECLSKAASTGQHLHVKIPAHRGCAPGGLAPMAIVVPSFASQQQAEGASNIIMPFWIDMPSDTPSYEEFRLE